MKTTNGIIALLALSAGAVFHAPAASAADYKNFSSNVCVPSGPAASNDLTYSTLGLLNTSTTADRVVVCPLLKDSEGSVVVSDNSFVTVEYRTAAGLSGRVNCTLNVGSISSGTYSVSSSQTTRPANTNASFLLAFATDPGWVYEPVNLACSLSPRTRLTRIYIYEATPTGT